MLKIYSPKYIGLNVETSKRNTRVDQVPCTVPEFWLNSIKEWMCSAPGGERTISHANQICSRAIKFVFFSSEDTPFNLSIDDRVDYYLGSIDIGKEIGAFRAASGYKFPP